MSTEFVFSPSAVVGLPIAGSAQQFPVRRVYCVGRNYAGHAREMGSDPTREPPFFFCKPGDGASVVPVPAGTTAVLLYPPQTSNYHHEVELVVAIGKGGSDIAVGDAADHIFGYAVGFDMTRRDLQGKMKEQGRPWEIGKAFDYSAPVGPIHPAAGKVFARGAISLDVDGQTRQAGDVDEMIWSISETIANLSTLFALAPGDLIFTGTPEGVGAVVRGQMLVGRIEGLTPVQVRIV